MFDMVSITIKGLFRDRVFHGILMVAIILPFIPILSTLSMRQVTELSLTLTLSLISFLLLLLATFLGGTLLWKDMERRYTYSVLSLPMTRASYLLGKFFGIALFLFFTALLLGLIGCVVVWLVSGNYPPDRPVVWTNLFLAVVFDVLKYILLVAFAVLFSTVSTSFFLPIFGTISIFFVGNASQQVYDYIHSQAGQIIPQIIRQCATVIYYILPNFSAFDLKINAIYGLPINLEGTILTLCYFVVYVSVVLSAATVIFERRELK